jgi:transcriptional regulator with XRE-family HTH domain
MYRASIAGAAIVTANQFKTAMTRLGMTQNEMATFLGLSLRAVHGYANDEVAVPLAIAKLLRLMIRLGLKPEAVK